MQCKGYQSKQTTAHCAIVAQACAELVVQDHALQLSAVEQRVLAYFCMNRLLQRLLQRLL
eukprot:14836-Heterococcus_DN1.PRE.4